jgi:hypothetical protein
MRTRTVLAVVVTVPTFLLSLTDLFGGSHYMKVGLTVGLLVPPAMVLSGLLMPKFGLWLSRSDEKFILEFLRRNLFAANASASIEAKS